MTTNDKLLTRTNCLLILAGLLLSFASCRQKAINQTKTTHPDTLATPAQWKQVKLDSSSFYQPAAWNAVKHDSCYYFAYLNNADKAKYFQIKRCKLSATTYLRAMYKGLLKNTNEKFDGYCVKRISRGKHDVYYSEVYTTDGKRQLLTCSMIFTDNDYLYNIGVKIDRTECAQYKSTLDNIVYNFKINGKNIFDIAAAPGEERVIDISKI